MFYRTKKEMEEEAKNRSRSKQMHRATTTKCEQALKEKQLNKASIVK